MSSSSCPAAPTPAMSVGNQFVHLGFFVRRNCIVYSIDNNIVSWETNDSPSTIYGKSLLKSFELREVRPFGGKEWVLPYA
jgi:hypothetical protein